MKKYLEEMTEEQVERVENLARIFIKKCCEIKQGNAEFCYTSSSDFAMISCPSGEIVYSDLFTVEACVIDAFDKDVRVLCTYNQAAMSEKRLSWHEAKGDLNDWTDMGNIEDLIPHYKTMKTIRGYIEEYQGTINSIPAMLEVAKKFDGKVINKRFSAAMYEAGYYASFSFDRFGRLKVNKRAPMHCFSRDNFDIVGIDTCKVCSENRRFNYAAFAEACEKAIETKRDYIAKWEADIKSGERRLAEYRKKEAELKELKGGFSYLFQKLERIE